MMPSSPSTGLARKATTEAPAAHSGHASGPRTVKASPSFSPRKCQGIRNGAYIIRSPIIKRSRLTSKDNGGIGKDLSGGWAANFAIGCTHACTFCYVDSIHRRYRSKALGFEDKPWGSYIYVPDNIDDAIAGTNWASWTRKEVMLSSTHDPYLPLLAKHTRRILELALPAGVRFCIQTRSPLVIRDLPLIERYREQVRVQVSVATMDRRFARAIEPRVAPPEARLRIIREAKARNIRAGIIIAPVFPPMRMRPDPRADVAMLMGKLAETEPDHIYGEALHFRGSNLVLTERSTGEPISASELRNFDRVFGIIFRELLTEHGLEGEWWPEHRM